MRRFVWRLQRVLDVRKKEEQVKTAELMKLTEELAQTRGRLLMQKRILADLLENISNKKSAERLAMQELFLKCSETTDNLIKELGKAVEKLYSQQKEKVAEVLKIKRYREGLEKLREKAKTEFLREQEKHEQKEMDDNTTISYARRIIHQNIL